LNCWILRPEVSEAEYATDSASELAPMSVMNSELKTEMLCGNSRIAMRELLPEMDSRLR